MKRIKATTEKQNTIGSNLKTYRKQAGLSQAQLSAKLELISFYLCRGSISRIENGNRIVSDMELVALAEVLGVTPHDLLRWNKK